jgi:uncharacterized protein YbjT (DUF2867 family)
MQDIAMPTALITGVTGQDGSYLAELLLAKGYRVVGVVRRTSHDSYERIQHLVGRMEILPADLLDQHSLQTVVRETQPDEVYNLAAQSFVPTSWQQPVLTAEFDAVGVIRMLEAIRLAVVGRAEEIEVMRLVGASDAFIRWPFIFEGAFVGVLGAAAALALLAVASGPVTDFMYGFFRVLPIELGSLQRDVVLLVVGTGFGVGVLGSWLSVRSYLTR